MDWHTFGWIPKTTINCVERTIPRKSNIPSAYWRRFSSFLSINHQCKMRKFKIFFSFMHFVPFVCVYNRLVVCFSFLLLVFLLLLFMFLPLWMKKILLWSRNYAVESKSLQTTYTFPVYSVKNVAGFIWKNLNGLKNLSKNYDGDYSKEEKVNEEKCKNLIWWYG